jgi:thiopurine S-methyltransferase
MQKFDVKYWNNLFEKNKLAWDIGYPAPALCEYFDQIKNKDIKILVPGAGNAYEVEYLFKNNFKNVFLLDFAPKAIESFKKRNPLFPDNQIIISDFFDHNDKYDLIVEHTFFTSFAPEKRKKFVQKIYNLLDKNGKYIGLFFNHSFGFPHPPFGATKSTYEKLFKPYFKFKTFQTAYNSIKPRKNREIFFIMIKK